MQLRSLWAHAGPTPTSCRKGRRRGKGERAHNNKDWPENLVVFFLCFIDSELGKRKMRASSEVTEVGLSFWCTRTLGEKVSCEISNIKMSFFSGKRETRAESKDDDDDGRRFSPFPPARQERKDALLPVSALETPATGKSQVLFGSIKFLWMDFF